MPGDLERLPAPVAPPAAGAGPAAVAAELLDIQGGGPGAVGPGPRSCRPRGARAAPGGPRSRMSSLVIPENWHSQEQALGMTPENTASAAAQPGELTPENVELLTEYARHLGCSLLSGDTVLALSAPTRLDAAERECPAPDRRSASPLISSDMSGSITRPVGPAGCGELESARCEFSFRRGGARPRRGRGWWPRREARGLTGSARPAARAAGPPVPGETRGGRAARGGELGTALPGTSWGRFRAGFRDRRGGGPGPGAGVTKPARGW
jgi:hypothetical protein